MQDVLTTSDPFCLEKIGNILKYKRKKVKQAWYWRIENRKHKFENIYLWESVYIEWFWESADEQNVDLAKMKETILSNISLYKISHN